MVTSPLVIKVGGNEVDDPVWVAELALRVAALTGPVVVVHGGGKEVSEVQRTLGAEPEWRDGLRITTPQAMRAVSMVLSGIVNKRLVRALIDAGVQAAGVSGEDASLLLADPALGGQLGRTGSIREVNIGLLATLLGAGIVPVVSPVSRSTSEGALNVNADDAAAAIAVAIAADELMMVSNVSGFLRGGTVVEEIEVHLIEPLIESGEAGGGMAPKLRASARAASGGVKTVRIGTLALLDSRECGTRVVRSSAVTASHVTALNLVQ